MTKGKTKVSKQEMKRIGGKALLKVIKSSKKIAKSVGVSQRTIQRLRHRRSQRKPGSGKPKYLGQRAKISILILVRKNPYITPQEIVDTLELECSKEPVRIYLIEAGFHYGKATNKEPLNQEKQVSRLIWAVEWFWFDFFEYVVYTDEAGFWLKDNNGKGWFRRHQKDDHRDFSTNEKLNVWVAVSMLGKIGIYIYEENLDQTVYLGVLQQALLPGSATNTFMPFICSKIIILYMAQPVFKTS